MRCPLPRGSACAPLAPMNTRQLEIFCAIMRDGSVTAAANSLSISQPAASKLLHHLEDQLGYALFQRIGGRLIPTPEADLLHEDAARVLREMEVLGDLARRVGERRLGLLRLGASLPVAWSVLPPALARFRASHPEVRIHLHTLPKQEIAEALRTGAIDLAVTLSPILAPTVRTQTLAPIPLAVLMPQGHALAGLDAVAPGDLAGQPLISYGSHAEIGPALDQAFRAEGLVRQVAIQVASSVAAVPLVRAGLGVALVDGLVDWADMAGLAMRPFRPRLAMGLALATDGARPIPRLAQALIALLRAPG
ncbi:transcriptional regulator, LysR family (plasmid) [Paracoccus denitrificans PD1222]|uniref:Transcriptional regulator, LysR family n=2 Tax=Paracoccaceae TaxID=31989 RepID=A1BBY8_PARDP|nr:transcriptional regulator, LysR family [Paracoccus denitrificans PD1222]